MFLLHQTSRYNYLTVGKSLKSNFYYMKPLIIKTLLDLYMVWWALMIFNDPSMIADLLNDEFSLLGYVAVVLLIVAIALRFRFIPHYEKNKKDLP